jgi:iron complex transport system substrate-binding protein
MKKFTKIIIISSLSFFIFIVHPISIFAKEITDMIGRKMTVPDKITRVFSVSPAVTNVLYAVDPDLIVGLNGKIQDYQKPYLRKSFQERPVLGGAFGTGLNLNYESVIKEKPDVIVIWSGDGAYDNKGLERIKAMGIPVAAVNIDYLYEYADTFKFLGKLLNREKRANELADYTGKVLNEVKTVVSRIPSEKKLTVYYAGMKDGLNSSCDKSWHAQLIPIAGGINPVKCVSGAFTGAERISMEQVILFNPDAIITMNVHFAEEVFKDKLWQDIKAIKTKRVYIYPKQPSGWVGGSSTFMGLLGLQWLTQRLYPELYKKNIEKEAQHFIKLFYQIDLSKDKIKDIINGN